ncbi:hypothetical protein CAPTEDRAFT_194161, partial [Capitella teleta]
MSKHESKKREFQRLFTGSLIKKYKLKREFCDMVGLPHLKRTCEDDTRKPMNRKKYNCKKLRPFWVVQATEPDRQTCLCRTHENFQFILEKLHSLKAIKSASCETVVKEAACDINSKLCMYGECPKCKSPALTHTPEAIDSEMSVTPK